MSSKHATQIITQNATLSWQEILANSVRDSTQLCHLLKIDKQMLPENHPLLRHFPVRVPQPFLDRIEKGNPDDPLLLQIFPAMDEATEVPGYIKDPLHEADSNPNPGILHKYEGRALLIATSSCAVHCRYCFRRHFPYSDNPRGKKGWEESLEYIRADDSIREIIFSGGDPLTLPDSYLGWFLDTLNTITHITRIRFHTRLPIMIPQRITQSLCDILAKSRFRTILVLHSNHASEMDDHVDEACPKLSSSGVILLNQTVLLKNINDNGKTLAALSERLFATGVMPYYLHLLDHVTGAAHFAVNEKDATSIHEELQSMLPGYLVPKLVREEHGKASKTVIM